MRCVPIKLDDGSFAIGYRAPGRRITFRDIQTLVAVANGWPESRMRQEEFMDRDAHHRMVDEGSPVYGRSKVMIGIARRFK